MRTKLLDGMTSTLVPLKLTYTKTISYKINSMRFLFCYYIYLSMTLVNLITLLFLHSQWIESGISQPYSQHGVSASGLKEDKLPKRMLKGSPCHKQYSSHIRPLCQQRNKKYTLVFCEVVYLAVSTISSWALQSVLFGVGACHHPDLLLFHVLNMCYG